jgi:multicomponent Na+:H+ antiporter subunit D
VSKSLTVSAVAEAHRVWVWLMLLFASAGVFHHAGIKVPYFIFFGHDSGIRTREPPVNMRVAMGAAAGICILLGVYPDPLYAILPHPVDYAPYTAFHVVGMLQLLMFGALAFAMLILSGFYPAEMRAVNLDTDWFFRTSGRAFLRFCRKPLLYLEERIDGWHEGIARWAGSIPGRAAGVERAMDSIFHEVLASLPDLAGRALRLFRTEKSDMFWNVTYILSIFVVLLSVAFVSALLRSGSP